MPCALFFQPALTARETDRVRSPMARKSDEEGRPARLALLSPLPTVRPPPLPIPPTPPTKLTLFLGAGNRQVQTALSLLEHRHILKESSSSSSRGGKYSLTATFRAHLRLALTGGHVLHPSLFLFSFSLALGSQAFPSTVQLTLVRVLWTPLAAERTTRSVSPQTKKTSTPKRPRNWTR